MIRTFILCLLVGLQLCILPPRISPFETAAMSVIDAKISLPRSSPEKEGISSSDILAFVEAADARIDQMHSLMIVRHGRVVTEGWWNPYDARTPHVLYSLSKSFTSTAVGMAIAEGKLSIDDPVLRFFPEDAPAEASNNLKAMRVRDLIRMNTGHQTEPQFWRGDPASGNATWVKKFLAHPVQFKPGTHFLYNTPATYMLSAIVQKTTGMTVLDYLRPRLFEPLGIENPTWVTSPEGITAGGYGLMVRTEEIARFGQLYLHKGMWKGKQLVPAAWVVEATSLQTSNGSAPNSDWDQGYGYQFWRSRHNTYRGDGAFGQYCIVIPEHDTVIAITSGVRNMQAVLDLVWEKLLPAFKSKPLPADAASRRRLESKLAGLAVRLPLGQPGSPIASKVGKRWYQFPENDRGIRAIAIDLESPALLIRTSGGETRTPIGFGSWIKTPGGFANGIDKLLSVPAHPIIGAAAAWSAEDVLTIKLVGCETPFYSTMTLRFDGDNVTVDSEYNVAFGQTKLPQLVGQSGQVSGN